MVTFNQEFNVNKSYSASTPMREILGIIIAAIVVITAFYFSGLLKFSSMNFMSSSTVRTEKEQVQEPPVTEKIPSEEDTIGTYFSEDYGFVASFRLDADCLNSKNLWNNCNQITFHDPGVSTKQLPILSIHDHKIRLEVWPSATALKDLVKVGTSNLGGRPATVYYHYLESPQVSYEDPYRGEYWVFISQINATRWAYMFIPSNPQPYPNEPQPKKSLAFLQGSLKSKIYDPGNLLLSEVRFLDEKNIENFPTHWPLFHLNRFDIFAPIDTKATITEETALLTFKGLNEAANTIYINEFNVSDLTEPAEDNSIADRLQNSYTLVGVKPEITPLESGLTKYVFALPPNDSRGTYFNVNKIDHKYLYFIVDEKNQKYLEIRPSEGMNILYKPTFEKIINSISTE